MCCLSDSVKYVRRSKVTESLPEIARHVIGLAKLVKEGLTMKLRRTELTWVGFMLLLASSAQAQVGTEGGILGVVLDASGAVVAGAEVTVTNLDTNLKKQAVTDATGNFEILALPQRALLGNGYVRGLQNMESRANRTNHWRTQENRSSFASRRGVGQSHGGSSG